jgi:hypothetical protein
MVGLGIRASRLQRGQRNIAVCRHRWQGAAHQSMRDGASLQCWKTAICTLLCPCTQPQTSPTLLEITHLLVLAKHIGFLAHQIPDRRPLVLLGGLEQRGKPLQTRGQKDRKY